MTAVEVETPERIGELALTRTPGECILIGENIEIEVRHVRGNSVRLLVRAPLNIRIERKEITQ